MEEWGNYLLIRVWSLIRNTYGQLQHLIDENLNKLVLDSHLDFIEAGSEIIVTNNFKVRKNTFNENGIR